MKVALNIGPVACAVEVKDGYQFYKKGIFKAAPS